jgi:hypothetical protein
MSVAYVKMSNIKSPSNFGRIHQIIFLTGEAYMAWVPSLDRLLVEEANKKEIRGPEDRTPTSNRENFLHSEFATTHFSGLFYVFHY